MKIFGYIFLLTVICTSFTALGAERSLAEVLMTHRFRVIFDQTDEIPAVEIRGLSSKTMYPEKKLKPVEIVIVRLMQPPDALWDWYSAVMKGKQERRSGLIEILNSDGTPAMSLLIREAIPIKWVWPTLNAEAPKPAREEIHFIAAEVRLLNDASRKLPEIRKKSPIKKKEANPFTEMEQELMRNLKRKGINPN